MKLLYKFAAIALLAGSGLAATVSASSAMPVATDQTVAGQAMIEKTAYGCGPGWRPNPRGHCVPFRRGPVVVVHPGRWHHHEWHHHEWRRHWHRD